MTGHTTYQDVASDVDAYNTILEAAGSTTRVVLEYPGVAADLVAIHAEGTRNTIAVGLTARQVRATLALMTRVADNILGGA